jgi:hypothetical protein
MENENANQSRGSSTKEEVAGVRPSDLGLYVFVALAFVALLTPGVTAAVWGVYWAAVIGILVFILWVFTMPTTCMSGGLVCSLAAMAIFFNAAVMLLLALVRFLFSLAA